MNPLRLRAQNFRTFDDLDVDLPEGCVAVVGSNGSGKSSLLSIISLCLFGPEGRSLEPYLRDAGADTELEIELTFEHAGETYRVRRGFSARGRGRTTCDFERADGAQDIHDFIPLTRENGAATQQLIEQTIGFSCETFRASCFLAQGESGAFTEAQPRARKAVLAECLGLSIWEQLLDLARQDKRALELAIAAAQTRIGQQEAVAATGPEIEARLEGERDRVGLAETALVLEEQKLSTLIATIASVEAIETQRQAAADRVRAAEAELGALLRIDQAGEQAEKEGAQVMEQLAGGTFHRPIEAIDEALAGIRLRLQAARDAARVEEESRNFQRDAERLVPKAAAVREKMRNVRESAIAHCDRCGHELDDEARMRSIESLVQETEAFETQIATVYDLRRSRDEEALVLRAKADGASEEMLGKLEAERRAAQDTIGKTAALRERLTTLERAIAARNDAEHRARVAAAEVAYEDAKGALAKFADAEPVDLLALRVDADAAKGRVREQRARLDGAKALVVRSEHDLERIAEAERRLEEERRAIESQLTDLTVIEQLERAYGRDGIPALIVENAAIPSIETEANRILAELGTSYRVELRTQRALKSGDGLADTLDIVIATETGTERPYESFSGGERTRINLALRIALARLLATRRSAEGRMLVLDEPEFLDAAGTAALVDVLRGLTDFDKTYLISHVPDLRDAFDQAIEVRKVGDRSEVLA